MHEPRPAHVSWDSVAAFRLSRQHLLQKGSVGKIAPVVAGMAGAQAQVLSAAQLSIWARLKSVTLQDLDSAIWKDRKLVRAWCMRRTLFLLPSDQLAIFARGTTRRSAYHYRQSASHVGSQEALDKLLDHALEILKQPSTRSELARQLNKSYGYKLKSKPGGGWGNKTAVPWVEVGKSSLPIGHLFHIIGARDVICSGPSKANESTYVRADKWIPHWKDMSVEKAERELLVKYLRAFGPSTVADFALWMGVYVRDAKPIWAREAENIVSVDVEGWHAGVSESDLAELEKAEIDSEPAVSLLPNFDSFLLGHKSRRNIVDAGHHQKVYRSQGWVSPVFLVDGRAFGVWSHTRKGNNLNVHVTPFHKLRKPVTARLQDEASDLARFLECSSVKTTIG